MIPIWRLKRNERTRIDSILSDPILQYSKKEIYISFLPYLLVLVQCIKLYFIIKIIKTGTSCRSIYNIILIYVNIKIIYGIYIEPILFFDTSFFRSILKNCLVLLSSSNLEISYCLQSESRQRRKKHYRHLFLRKN